MPIRAGIEIEFEVPPKELRRLARDGQKDAMRAGAAHWIERYLPRHFTEAAYGLYGYQERSGDSGEIHKDAKVSKEGVLYRRAKDANGNWITLRGSAVVSGGKGYVARKLKRFGHNKPLVWTGRLQREVLGSARVTGAAGTSATVGISGRALNLSGRKKMPNMKQEVTTVIESERADIARVAAERYTQLLNGASRGAA